jgi:3-deoxy-D-manno-octulosonic-acid transferase
VLLVDRVGVLAELYAHADCAYVGGAFTTGVHNVMEPAIAALPVWFGPRHHNAPEAAHLVEAGAAAVVRSPVELSEHIQTIWDDPQQRHNIGTRARDYVESNLGASQRCVQRILPFLPAPGRSEESP